MCSSQAYDKAMGDRDSVAMTKRTLNMSKFSEQFGQSSNYEIPNPEVKAEKILKKLVRFFHEVLEDFDKDE
jgi:hypothetical protein